MDEKKGLVIVHTGDGKGKTTAALGLALRAWGDGLKILILQFIKGGQKSGELKALQKDIWDGRILIKQCGKGFTRRDEKNAALHKAAAREALDEARREIKSGAWDMVILDEINYAVKFELISERDALELLDERDATHLVFTGRDAAPELVRRADLVTQMQQVKHHFQRGVAAQIGIEF